MKFDLEWGGLHTVISGGQTGVDQAALMAAWKLNVQTGGTAPASYKTSDGYNPLLEVFGLKPSGSYEERTQANVSAADATVIIAHNLNSAGTDLTRRLVRAAGKKLLEVNISDSMSDYWPLNEHSRTIAEFILKNQIQVLNVAGNRELPSSGRVMGTSVVFKAAEWLMIGALSRVQEQGKLISKV